MNDLKYWRKGVTEHGYGVIGFVLDPRIMSIRINKAGNIEMVEECDGNYLKEVSKQEAIEIFEEAIEIIKLI